MLRVPVIMPFNESIMREQMRKESISQVVTRIRSAELTRAHVLMHKTLLFLLNPSTRSYSVMCNEMHLVLHYRKYCVLCSTKHRNPPHHPAKFLRIKLALFLQIPAGRMELGTQLAEIGEKEKS